MKKITISICFIQGLFCSQAIAGDAVVGGQLAKLGSLATIASINYEAKGSNDFSWAAKAGNLSYAWENTYNNGSGLEKEDGSGLYLSIDFYRYLDHALEGIYFGAGYGIAMIDWKYKDENISTGKVWSQSSGSATISESHVVLGSKFKVGKDMTVDPSLIVGSFISASTSGQDMLGIFFLPSIAFYMDF